MILEVTLYGHPALRARGRKISNIDDRVRRLAEDMIETMRHKNGVGLAAQQIGLPLQIFVLEVLQNQERPSEMWIDSDSVAFDHLMPMVVINPEIKLEGEIVADREGCLSFPDVFGDIPRPGCVYLKAQDLDGKPIEFRAGGLLARAIQHEFDHLQGVLFIDRMDVQTRQELESFAKIKSKQDLSPFLRHAVLRQPGSI